MMSPLLVADSSQGLPSASSPTVSIQIINLITVPKKPDWVTQKELQRGTACSLYQDKYLSVTTIRNQVLPADSLQEPPSA